MLNNKISKYIIIFMIFFMSFVIDVNAQHIVDFSKKGSIEITLEEQEENKGISGVEITIYKIADAKSENNNLVFEYIEQRELIREFILVFLSSAWDVCRSYAQHTDTNLDTFAFTLDMIMLQK